ncbi:cysteine desulfurase Csd [Thermacetogenium phaeum DSM 12270]|uniref:cysteine desulfurase n=2 Tax=Thermacetogenium phaeum TaxID=85874 RepID=K4LE84_THEPS|nr:aminotransferase class V-fold PLP-dependent enzyme [Thermacetogenium phaeum]AFV11178.1 cysteine desulfurase Csd [Thermacetogenium phaeum DSM 12270]KUK35965.1 MAG: Cysteine desulfurase Csd [Thermacetogenium phaeum]
MNDIYLDNAATSWPKPESVYRAVDHFNRKLGASPGRGSHRRSVISGQILLETRESLARLFNIKDSSRIAFTVNVTEAINIALKGLLEPGDHVVISSMEHNAVVRPLHALKDKGVELTVVRCSPDGTLDPSLLEQALTLRTRLVCLLHASNITGTIMPVAEVGRIVRRKGILFMVDAAQSAGVLPVDVEEQNIDLLAFTGHKGLLGPQGTGGLYIRPGLDVRPLVEGGTGSQSERVDQPDFMPDRFESGTPNTPGIAGLNAGVQFIQETGLEKIRQHEQELTDALIQGLREIKGVILYGPCDSRRQTAVVSFNIEDRDCGEVSFLLDQKYGIQSRSGLHCAPLAHRTMGTLKRGACRLSPGFFNTMEDIHKVIKAVYEIATSG